MYIDVVKNRNSPPCILVRESYREEGKVKKRTLANISKLPQAVIDTITKAIKGGWITQKKPEEIFSITQTKPHGHAKAIWETAKKLKLHTLFPKNSGQHLEMLIALIAARIIDPKSKLATARMLEPDSGCSTLPELCNLTDSITHQDIYTLLDWLESKQQQVEDALAKRHLKNDAIVFYDLTSVWVEGKCCPLAKHGYSRDGNNKQQINIGLLCDSVGRPIACEVFEGNTGDPTTVKSQLKKLKERFNLESVVFVGDRGMLTQARIDEDLSHWEGIYYITALGSQAVGKIMASEPIQPELFDEEYHAAEITHPDYPGERLVVCYNPQLAKKRAHAREKLLDKTSEQLKEIQAAVQRNSNPYHGKTKIAARIERQCRKYKMLKHYQITIEDKSISWEVNLASFEAESKLDGIYIVRSKGLDAKQMDKDALVTTYKNLSHVEQAFRSIKTLDLRARPIYHYKPERVRAHIFLCMLAYYVQWEMKDKLKPLLFADEDVLEQKNNKLNAAQPYCPSKQATKKCTTKNSVDGLQAESFQTLLSKLGTMSWNLVQIDIDGNKAYTEKITQPNALQKKAFSLLGIKRFW